MSDELSSASMSLTDEHHNLSLSFKTLVSNSSIDLISNSNIANNYYLSEPTNLSTLSDIPPSLLKQPTDESKNDPEKYSTLSICQILLQSFLTGVSLLKFRILFSY